MKTTLSHPNQAEQTARERILQTAHDLFYREGIRATGVDRIIAQAHVTKVTFYRHFPSKNDLIAAYLDYRHTLWMNWFTAALARAPREVEFPLAPIVSALREWFESPEFRGCAFINGLVELESAVAEVSLRHKQDMTNTIAILLPSTTPNTVVAMAAAMAIDGAILRVQMEKKPELALGVLENILRALCECLLV